MEFSPIGPVTENHKKVTAARSKNSVDTAVYVDTRLSVFGHSVTVSIDTRFT
jgi:hypothetical protein